MDAFDSLRPRLLPIVGLLALLPVGVYALAVSPIVVLSLVSVVIVAASLYYLFSPAESDDAPDEGPGAVG
jgi:hypothetical protein